MNAQVPASSNAGAADQVYTKPQPVRGGSGHRDVTCSVPAPTVYTVCTHSAGQTKQPLGACCGPSLQPHPLSSGHSASRKRNQCTPASHRSKYALELNLVPSLCQWITESAQEAMVSLALISLLSSQLRTPRNKKLVFTVLPDSLGREQSQLWPTQPQVAFHALSKASKNSACLLANAALTNG